MSGSWSHMSMGIESTTYMFNRSVNYVHIYSWVMENSFNNYSSKQVGDLSK